MRFESVEAYAFGPFRDASLELGPGMNVVFGPNEAGKSTWHAALYAGLCGIRRGRGKGTRADLRFEQRHRPWDANGAWGVGVRVALADGRRVVLRHDLAGRIDSSARDADLAGRDYSHEVVFEGAPDGSRWLGLNRRSFLHTACVRQAQMLAVREDAGALQGALQAAAATAGKDATAARALELLKGFRSEHVGSERARTKPLVQSRREVEAARAELDSARGTRDEYQRKRAQLAAREAMLRATRARLFAGRAREAGDRLGRIRELSRRFESGQPRLFDDPELADRVARDVATWKAQSTPESPAPAEELERRLADVEAELDRVAVRARRKRGWLFAAGVLGVVAGLAGGGGYSIMLGWPVAVLGLGMLGWASVWRGAGRRQPLEAQRTRILADLPQRRRQEEEFAQAQRRLEEAERALRRAAADAGLEDGPPAALVDALYRWQARRHDRLRRFEKERSDWSELQRLLGDRTLGEWTTETERLEAEAVAHAADMPGEPDPERDAVATLEHLERRQQETLERERGALEERERNLLDVAEAEERLAQAERRERETARLDATLATTIDFLATAELRVHRDVAQVLRDTVLEWLPRVTGGRYVDCRVDPATLAVEACGPDGHFRSADLLSHGTAEQVYLLLRLALARHLTRPEETCPLLLDDALSGCDAARARAVLETLLAIADETQVILFTHDDDVGQWADRHLEGPGHRLIELEPPPA